MNTYGQYAINCYLEYLNDFLTIKSFAEYKSISIKTASGLVSRGKILHEQNILGMQLS